LRQKKRGLVSVTDHEGFASLSCQTEVGEVSFYGGGGLDISKESTPRGRGFLRRKKCYMGQKDKINGTAAAIISTLMPDPKRR